MKGTIVTDAIATIAILVILIILFFSIPTIISQMQEIFVQDSPRIVSRDIAGLATMSAASVNDIKIHYSVHDQVSYDIEFEDRVVTVAFSNIDLATYENSTSRMGVSINKNLADVSEITIQRISGNIEVDGS